ncbi:hypothetical protein [Microbispora bryophytorum]|uniref:hypothetical protein n=1 Tax=Microbispora bryophytorum TaxID=1460882 RepID=UPI0033E16DFC
MRDYRHLGIVTYGVKEAVMQQATTSTMQPVLTTVLWRVRARIAAEQIRPGTVRVAHAASIPEHH